MDHVFQSYRCTKYHSGIYCSKRCQATDYEEHKSICNYISQLERLEQKKRFGQYDCNVDLPVLPKNLNKLLKLIGSKSKINFDLNGIKCKGLWDTGSMVS